MAQKKFPSTYVTSDIVVFHQIHASERILLIKRKNEPFKGDWALPGGFFDPQDLNVKACAARELAEEVSLVRPIEDFKLVGVYSEKNRDPRGNNSQEPCRVISIAFMICIEGENAEIKACDDASDWAFFDVTQLPPLAFDHFQIVSDALSLKRK